jgi:histidinol-phosphate aminotransferase
MRIGYAFGNKKLIKYLNDVKYSVNSYTMNTPALITGAAAIKDKDHFEDITAKIVKTREKTQLKLKETGFTFNESSTNFIFAKPPEGFEAVKIFEELKKRDIYVRHFNKERIRDYLRITIGTDEEMEILMDALKEIMK